MAKILIADESEIARNTLAEELTAAGHEVVKAGKYHEAAEALEKSIRVTDKNRKAFDLICLAPYLSDRSGVYTLFRIRDQPFLIRARVLGAIIDKNVWRDIDERNTHLNFRRTEKQRREGQPEYVWNLKDVLKFLPSPA